jgi:hypothetical protein
VGRAHTQPAGITTKPFRDGIQTEGHSLSLYHKGSQLPSSPTTLKDGLHLPRLPLCHTRTQVVLPGCIPALSRGTRGPAAHLGLERETIWSKISIFTSMSYTAQQSWHHGFQKPELELTL